MNLKYLIHPNRISFYGLGLTAIGTGMLFSPSTQEYGAGMILAGCAMDGLDGQAARRLDMKTKEGARIDSLFDKVKNSFLGGYVAVAEAVQGDVILPVMQGINVVNDFLWQRQRGPYSEQIPEAVRGVYDPASCTPDNETRAESKTQANYWGKTKAVVQMGVGLGYVGKQVLEDRIGDFGQTFNDNLEYGMAAALGVSAVLGTIGGYSRLRKSWEKRELSQERNIAPYSINETSSS